MTQRMTPEREAELRLLSFYHSTRAIFAELDAVRAERDELRLVAVEVARDILTTSARWPHWQGPQLLADRLLRAVGATPSPNDITGRQAMSPASLEGPDLPAVGWREREQKHLETIARAQFIGDEIDVEGMSRGNG